MAIITKIVLIIIHKVISMDMVIIEIFESAISLSLPPVNPPFRPKGQRTKGPSALPPFDIVVTQIIITINIIIIHHRCCNTDHDTILNNHFV